MNIGPPHTIESDQEQPEELDKELKVSPWHQNGPDPNLSSKFFGTCQSMDAMDERCWHGGVYLI